MKGENEAAYMIANGWMGPRELLYGVQRRWATPRIVAEWAERLAATRSDEHISRLLLATELDDHEVTALLNRVAASSASQATDSETKWRAAFVHTINLIHDPDRAFEQLQDVLDDFEFPEDMWGCHRYVMPRYLVRFSAHPPAPPLEEARLVEGALQARAKSESWAKW
jgi:hypothetical protein